MSSRYKCPNCEEECDHFDVRGNYTEYGSCRGTRSLSDTYDEWDDQNCSESEYEDQEYECPECNYEFDFEFVQAAEDSRQEVYDEDAEEPEEIVVATQPQGMTAEELRRAWELMHNVPLRAEYSQMSNGNIVRETNPTQVIGINRTNTTQTIIDECVEPDAEVNGSLNTQTARNFVHSLNQSDDRSRICKNCGTVIDSDDITSMMLRGEIVTICYKCEQLIKLDE